MTQYRLFGVSLRTLFLIGFIGLFALAALAIDLAKNGPTDQLLWEVTGEADSSKQLVGGLQYLANLTRQMPNTAPYAEVQNIPANPFGINGFLEQEAEPEKREQSMQLIADAGFGWLRQHFPWEDIEIAAKDDFWDMRNATIDHNGDGLIDRQDGHPSWDKYDHIVDLAEQYNVNILARLSGPIPPWALPAGITYTSTPPANVQDFVDYAVAVATRYQGRIHYYQIWNEPNLTAEWGNQLVDPQAYTELLCRTHDALKAIDPDIIILTGAIGPTIDLSGYNAYDMLYLQRMYDLGAGECFDILSAQGYGLFSGPTDRRMRPYTVNFARHAWLRDIMVANSDAAKPIWISEAGWNPVPNDPTLIGYETYGRVTMEQAANWSVLAYQRARDEWPWVGVISYWFLKRPNEQERNQSWYYFRLVEPTWETTPVYQRLQQYIQSGDWQKPATPWPKRARERLPQVLVIAWAVLMSGYIMGDAVFKRLSNTR